MEIKLNKYINKIFYSNKYLSIEEIEKIEENDKKRNIIFSIENEGINVKTVNSDESDFLKIKNAIISDSLIDLKVITVPIVSKIS